MEKKYNDFNRDLYKDSDDYYDEADEYEEEAYQEFKKSLSRARKKDRASKLKKMNKRDRRD